MNDLAEYLNHSISKKQVMLFQNNFNSLTVYKPKYKNDGNPLNSNYSIQFPTSAVAIDTRCDWFLQGKRNGRIALWRFQDTRPSSTTQESGVLLKSKKHTSARTPVTTLLDKNDPVYQLKWYSRDNGMFFQLGEESVRIWDTNSMQPVFECPTFKSMHDDEKLKRVTRKIDVFDDLILYGEQLIDLRTLTSHLQIKGASRISSNSIFHFEGAGNSNNKDSDISSGQMTIVTGHVDGIVNRWDIRNLKSPLLQTNIGKGMINDISIQNGDSTQKNDIWVVNNQTTITKIWSLGSKILSNFKNHNLGTKIDSLYVDQSEQIIYCQDKRNVSIFFYENEDGDGLSDSTTCDSKVSVDSFSSQIQAESNSYKYWNQVKTPERTGITCMDIRDNCHIFGLQNGGIAEWVL